MKELAIIDDVKKVKLVLNNSQENKNVYINLKDLFKTCKSFYLSVAFINYSGLQLLLDSLRDCERRGVKGKVLCSDYLGFTQPSSIEKLYGFKNIETRMFRVDAEDVGFHTKGYIFEYDDCYKVLIGSSNITQSALKSNIEWNIEVVSKNDDKFIVDVINDFNLLMVRSREVDEAFIQEYREYYENLSSVVERDRSLLNKTKELVPNYFQNIALKKLEEFRKNNINKALLVASTGTGKTYAAAFDVKAFKPQKLLFIVHNETILNSAKASFERLIKDKKCGLFTGNVKSKDCDFLFATIQTISKVENYSLFKQNEFDYIVYDEAHRIMGKTYLRLLDYFKPKFLLGMTATPERTDGGNIFKLFDYHIACDIRLEDALEHNLLVPFHYFGINDTTVDLVHMTKDNDSELSKVLSNYERADFIMSKMEDYGYDGKKRKCLAFCVDKKHCEFMAEQFNKEGFSAVALTSESDIKERDLRIAELQNDNNPLKIICTVNIFNEGVDIPDVNEILMLRPTESAIIFTQQLGRGLRKSKRKSFLTVLDFIANYSRSYLIAVALAGKDSDDKDGAVRVVKHGNTIFGNTNIEFDPISTKRILEQLRQTNFNNLVNLAKAYSEFLTHKEGKQLMLVDFFEDNSPDPIRFINYSKNYYSFVNSHVDNEQFTFVINPQKRECLNFFSKMLPLKSPSIFLAINILIQKDSSLGISKEYFYDVLKQYVFDIDFEEVEFTFNCLKGDYYDKSEQKYIDYFKVENDKLLVGKDLKPLLADEEFRAALLDIVMYGILRYFQEFGTEFYGCPFLKLYATYSMRELGILSRYTKIHSSIRGSGVWADLNNNIYLFVELEKDKKIKESINYKDFFVDPKHFQWQSPNNTKISSDRGKIFIQERKGYNLHLFARKVKEVDGVIMPYIYVGKVNCLSYEGEQPITIQYELENELPMKLYQDFVEVYDD